MTVDTSTEAVETALEIVKSKFDPNGDSYFLIQKVVRAISQERDEWKERAEKAETQCEFSWHVIANAYEGDWSEADSRWRIAAGLCEWPWPNNLPKSVTDLIRAKLDFIGGD